MVARDCTHLCACMRVYARVLVPPNLYICIHTYLCAPCACLLCAHLRLEPVWSACHLYVTAWSSFVCVLLWSIGGHGHYPLLARARSLRR